MLTLLTGGFAHAQQIIGLPREDFGKVILSDRHSFASIAAANGVSLPIIGALLEHSQPQTTARYAHLAAEPLKQASALVGGLVTGAMKGTSL